MRYLMLPHALPTLLVEDMPNPKGREKDERCEKGRGRAEGWTVVMVGKQDEGVYDGMFNYQED
ncbi:hypothetical protein BDR07DRAFT_1359714 [Suillus spraguei]|nr:hypothetical protein BDR07DRAFT_1359714 [Suillus spraguei]